MTAVCIQHRRGSIGSAASEQKEVCLCRFLQRFPPSCTGILYFTVHSLKDAYAPLSVAFNPKRMDTLTRVKVGKSFWEPYQVICLWLCVCVCVS
jgi:hypothetical protein